MKYPLAIRSAKNDPDDLTRKQTFSDYPQRVLKPDTELRDVHLRLLPISQERAPRRFSEI